MTNGLATKVPRRTTHVSTASSETRLSAQLLGSRLIGHGVMADVVLAATPAGVQVAREVARLLRASLATFGAIELSSHERAFGEYLARARVVIVDDLMVSGTAMAAAVAVAREHGAGQIVAAAPAASPEAVAAVLPLVHSVHTLNLRAHLRTPGRRRSTLDGITEG